MIASSSGLLASSPGYGGGGLSSFESSFLVAFLSCFFAPFFYPASALSSSILFSISSAFLFSHQFNSV
jgi:hypothetical protein